MAKALAMLFASSSCGPARSSLIFSDVMISLFKRDCIETISLSVNGFFHREKCRLTIVENRKSHCPVIIRRYRFTRPPSPNPSPNPLSFEWLRFSNSSSVGIFPFPVGIFFDFAAPLDVDLGASEAVVARAGADWTGGGFAGNEGWIGVVDGPPAPCSDDCSICRSFASSAAILSSVL